jgi:biopolymer transport protein ExbD
MAKYKKNSNFGKEIDLPTLIDMVFLLLIFFIASLSISSGGGKDVAPPMEGLTLPSVAGIAAPNEGQLSTLVFQIERKATEQNDTVKVLYVLWPDGETKSEDQALKKIRENFIQAKADSLYAEFPSNLFALSQAQIDTTMAFKVIKSKIKQYQGLHFNAAELSNTIEIKADKETEFKIISYIMDQCATYNDKIPKVTFRVMAPKQREPVEGTDVVQAH